MGITTAKSEKKDKTHANRKLRRKVTQAIRERQEVMPELHEVSDVWNMAKDGKRFVQDCDDKWMRK